MLWSEDERMLFDSARSWADGEHPVSRFRALRDSGRRWDPPMWAEMVELGWPAIGLDEEAGGMGLGARAAICESLGRNLVPTPLISAWMTADLDPEADSEQGEVRALAWEEASTRGRAQAVHSMVRDGRLTGDKRAVLDPGAATHWLVSARESGGIQVYRVPLDAGTVQTTTRIDMRDAATVRFEDAPCIAIADADALQHAIDRATLALCAEMVGGMQAALELTLAYTKERKQFGAAIGSFQSVQHRMVDCFIQIELARSTVMAALRQPTVKHIALAKASCSETYVHVSYEAIQFHGGIGVTDEHDIGFHLKRARVAARTFGNASYQRDRWATAQGY
jgi:alkylation response protein AidB-like acyl-CoA dehydrogenase